MEYGLQNAGGKGDASRLLETVIWPEVIRINNVGPRDALWKCVNDVCVQTLPPAGHVYDSYEPWLEQISRLWLTISSTRHLLVRWLRLWEFDSTTNPPKSHTIVQKVPELSDFDASFEQSLKKIEHTARFCFHGTGLMPPPEINFISLRRKLQLNFAPENLSISYLDKDRTRPIGILDYDVAQAPAVTPYRNRHDYSFSDHTMSLPVVWTQELTPTRIFPSDDHASPNRFTDKEVGVHLVLELLREAHRRKIPLVARDTPLNVQKP